MIDAKNLLTVGAGWKFFSLLFRCPSDVAALSVGTLIGELEPELRHEARVLSRLIRNPHTEGAYHALLGSGGPVSPYESDYRNPGEEGMREKGVVLGDVAAFYKAFMFEPSKELLEAPDHVAVELAFMSYLKLKEAYALMCDEHEACEICREAEENFLDEHLLRWTPLFVDRLARHAHHKFYEKSAHLFRDWTC